MSKPITIELRKRCTMEAFQEWLDARQPGYTLADIDVDPPRHFALRVVDRYGPDARPKFQESPPPLEVFQTWLDKRQPGFVLVDIEGAPPCQITLHIDDRRAPAQG